MTPVAPRALIAEDEPLLAAALQQELRAAWPELQIAATVGDGISAIQQALALQPDVLFFDIRMPGQTGLDAAVALADAWPAHQPFPALVFVTAYDQYAVQAFEAQAVDYLIKPVQSARLQKNSTKTAPSAYAESAISYQFNSKLRTSGADTYPGAGAQPATHRRPTAPPAGPTRPVARRGTRRPARPNATGSTAAAPTPHRHPGQPRQPDPHGARGRRAVL